MAQEVSNFCELGPALSVVYLCPTGKQLALLNTNSAVRTCGFDFSGNIIMFSTDKQMGYQCFLNFFDLRDPQQIGTHTNPLKHYVTLCLILISSHFVE